MTHICGACHQVHEHVVQTKQCYGLVARSEYFPSRPVMPASPPVRLATEAQVAYVEKLGGDAEFAKTLSVHACSKYIDNLKKNPRKPERSARVEQTFQYINGDMLKGMLPVGYFAGQLDSSSRTIFFRVKTTAKNSRRYPPDSYLVQQAHGNALGLSYTPVCAVWPNGTFKVYDKSLEPELMTVMADHHSAARMFGQLLGHCARCNAELTDERSRYYGIGPECEQHWPWFIPEVEEEKGAYRV